jgi:hypothetical protein
VSIPGVVLSLLLIAKTANPASMQAVVVSPLFFLPMIRSASEGDLAMDRRQIASVVWRAMTRDPGGGGDSRTQSSPVERSFFLRCELGYIDSWLEEHS